jgi:hypothetical protein
MNKKSYFSIPVIATAMLGAMVLSSCSHDDYGYSEEKVEQAVNAKYAAAFERAFGKVGSDVDWGFRTKDTNARAITRAVGTYAQYKGNIQPTLNPPFPSDCDASNFLDAYPAGVGKLPTWGAGAGSYYVDAESPSVSTWAGASKIYVTGTVDLSTGDTNAEAPKFAPDYRSEIYLLEGSKLILGEVSAINFNVDAIYIADGATLETSGLLKANSNTKVYNHGTIKVGTFEVNTSSFLYNVGTLTAGSVNAESNDSRIVNDGTINAAAVVVNAGAVQNNAEWTVTGTTEINSNNSGWVNNGHWTTYNYAYIGGSENVINNCFLEVENDFAMNISSEQGSFKIDGGGGVLTKYFDGGRASTGAVSGPFVIIMGPKAVFVVEETAILESGRGDENGFGIFGPSTGEYAVFQAKNIARDPYLESINSHGAVTYGGNLYVSAETHFAQGKDSDGSGSYVPQPFIYEKDGFSIANNIYAAGFKSGKPNINIPETPCSPGFKGGAPLYRVIAEDLSASEAGDFDFNDVVFDVVKAEGGKTTLKLICAGGVLPLTVGGVEVHAKFGDTSDMLGNHPMYNTGAGPNADPVTFDVDGTFTTPEQIKNIEIMVYKNGSWMELTATRGEAACKILVDDTFIPVPERQNIADKNKKFTDYVQGKFVDDFWWK